MKEVLILLITGILISCQPRSNDGAANQEPALDDYCESFRITLNGAFAAKYVEGTMTWTGGLEGQVEISGADYNDMTCSYKITDCEGGVITMQCDGSAYNTLVELYSPDSLKIGPTYYSRVN